MSRLTAIIRRKAFPSRTRDQVIAVKILQIKTQPTVQLLPTALKNARAELDIQKQTNESELDRASLTLEVARMALERFVKGDHPQKLRDLGLKIDQAASRRDQAIERFANMLRAESSIGFLAFSAASHMPHRKNRVCTGSFRQNVDWKKHIRQLCLHVSSTALSVEKVPE